MAEIRYKHGFVVRKGRYIWDDKAMFKRRTQSLEGKRGYAIIEEEKEEVSPDQWAYYRGVIIRKYCMNSECFSGLTDDQIDSILRQELSGHTVVYKNRKGERKHRYTYIDLKSAGKKVMTEFIEEVIAHLQVEYNIHPAPSDHFKFPKYTEL